MNEMMTFLIRPLLFIGLCLMFYVPGKHALHMYQQNRYELGRYLQWFSASLRTSILSIIRSLLVGLVLSLIIIFFELPGQLLTLALIYLFAIFSLKQEKRKPYIKPLKVTARVKRQIVLMVLLTLVFVYYLVAYYSLSPLPLLAMMYENSIVHLMLILMAVITEPIEALIKRFYVELAKRELRKHHNLIKIGITGSYGKTSSKNILDEILSEEYYVLATPASFNTPMGITITIRQQLKNLHEVFIVEMGADKVGEINTLTKFVRPQYGIVTSIGPQHLATFKSINNIIKEKMKMIENLPQDGVGVLNFDNDYIRHYKIQNTCRIITVGIESMDVDFRAIDITYTPEGSGFNVQSEDGSIPFKTRLLGKHNVSNILVAIAVGRALRLPWDKLQKAVANVNYIEHRLQLKKINGLTFIDNAFNSNPEGSRMSLEVLKMMPGKRFIITPGMIDLGNQQKMYNSEFGKTMKDCADVVILVGKNQTRPIYEGLKESGFEMENVFVFTTVKEAFAYVHKHASSKDTILLENDLPDAFSR
jgi:UDP-N-acetylmuramoyl-tripeptide--D-alanyl-D-alanine ligase